MDWIELIKSLGLLIGGGGIYGLATIRIRIAKDKLEVDQKAIDQWKELFERTELENTRKAELIDKLYDDLKEARKNENDATTEVAKLLLLRCDKLSCTIRKPPLSETIE